MKLMTISPITQSLLPYFFLKGVGPATFRAALGQARSLRDTEALERALQSNRRVAAALKEPAAWDIAIEKVRQQAKLCVSHDGFILSPFDDAYPTQLAWSAVDPVFLFCKGNSALFSMPTVAIVGSRKPTRVGKVVAERLAAFIGNDGYCVLSGLAIGCDTIAHSASLAVKAPNMAVLAHGLQTITPGRNAALAAKILECGGLLVSPFAFGVEPRPEFYVRRDLLQAALSSAVVMVQSSYDGGSLHAARSALALDRLLVVPAPASVDVGGSDPVIEATRTISSGDVGQIKRLLECEDSHLKNIFVVTSKADYANLALVIGAAANNLELNI